MGWFSLRASPKGSGDELTLKKMDRHIKRLVKFSEACDEKGIKEELRQIVPMNPKTLDESFTIYLICLQRVERR